MIAIGWQVAAAFPLTAPAAEEKAVVSSTEGSKAPIRVGGNVMASKLVHSVEPIYPDEAKAARVIGLVILEALVNEEGHVENLKVLRGHPLLNEAAMEAVQQWRYSPTELNGEPVPVLCSVDINFGQRDGQEQGGSAILLKDPPKLVLRLDADGILWEGKTRLEGADLLDRAEAANGPILILPEAEAPSQYLTETVQLLKRAGTQKVYVFSKTPIEF